MTDAAPSSPPGTPSGLFGVDVRGLVDDLLAMFQARRELAELELRADVASSKRLAVVAGVAVVMVLTSLPLLVASLAQLLQAWHPLGASPVNGWYAILGGGLLLLGTLLAWVGYRRFRREFVGLRQSLAEFREDVQWLREWTQQDDRTDGDEAA